METTWPIEYWALAKHPRTGKIHRLIVTKASVAARTESVWSEHTYKTKAEALRDVEAHNCALPRISR